MAALRSYETIVALDKMRKGLEKILDSTSTLFQVNSLQQFAAGVLTQLSAFLGCQPNGIICVQYEIDKLHDSQPQDDGLRVLVSTGECSGCGMNGSLNTPCRDPAMLDIVRQALRQQKSQLTSDYTVLYLDTGDTKATAVLLHGGLGAADENDKKLLEVFAAKISIALANALNYQKMMSAEQAATTDFLTGLNNRRQLLRLGLPLVAGAKRHGTPLAIAMLDIDHFKRINDTWGHDAGDEVLVRIGQLLKTNFRTSDVVARFGGEEFCIVAPGLAPQEAFALFDAFRSQWAQETFTFGGAPVATTISIGVSTVVVDSLDTMIATADAQLYRAKLQGRNQVQVA